MNIERIELLTTLKGKEVWKKGTIFDPKKDGHPIPPEIIAEVRANTGTVRVLKAISETSQPVASIDTQISDAEIKLAELRAEIAEAEAKMAELTKSPDDEKKETDNFSSAITSRSLTGSDIRSMTHKEILDLLKDEEDFELLKGEKRTVLVGIATKRLIKND